MNENGLSGIRAIVFDLDDTLYDKGEWLVPAIEHAANGGNLDGQVASVLATEYISIRGCADAGIFNHILLGMGQSDSVINIRAFLARMNEYHAEPGSLQLHPGALEALINLKGRCRLAVVAVGPSDLQRSKINALGLSELVDAVIVVADGPEKQSVPALARGLTTSMNRLTVRAGFTLFVADNPFRDFVTVRPLGVQTVRVLTGEYGAFDYPSVLHTADYDISSIARLPELLEQPPPRRLRGKDEEQASIQHLVQVTGGLDGGRAFS